MVGDAIRWIDENADVREYALREARLGDGEAVADGVAADPARLIDAGKALAIEAVRRDAPAGVVEALLEPVRRMTATARRRDDLQFALDTLASMRGMRDESEMAPVLTRAIAEAPDELNRRRLEAMLHTLRNPLDLERLRVAEDEVFLGPEGTTEPSAASPVDCVACCVLGCMICTEICPLCCIAGCIFC